MSKNAGFKPIGQPTASVKKFFPDDDEQEESPPQIHASSSARTHSDLVAEGESLDITPHMSNGKHFSRHHSQSRFREESLPESRGIDELTSIEDSMSAFHQEMAPQDDIQMVHVQSGVPPDAQGHEIEVLTPTTRAPSPSRGARDELYAIVSQVGEGTFGKVYKARNNTNGRFVALKRIRMEAERDGFPVTAMREIKLLQSLRHINVVRLYEMMVSNGTPCRF